MSINPGIDTAEVEELRPQMLTLLEVRKLLITASDYKSGVMLPYFAISLFAGLRPSDLGRIFHGR